MAVNSGLLDPARPDLRVVQAEAPDAVEILGLRDDLARWMTAQGIEQWEPGQLPRCGVESAIAEGRVFAVRAGIGLAASVTIAWDDALVWDVADPSAGY